MGTGRLVTRIHPGRLRLMTVLRISIGDVPLLLLTTLKKCNRISSKCAAFSDPISQRGMNLASASTKVSAVFAKCPFKYEFCRDVK